VDRQGKDTWTVFKIMGEFVEGFETLRPFWPCVSVFGSARVGPEHPAFGQAVRVAQALAEAGFSVITGGGPGIMEAANRGARERGAHSIGLNIRLPYEQGPNGYADTVVHFNYFFARKVMFVKYSCGLVAMPGGFGTLDEVFEALTLAQTQKIHDFPVVFFGREHWEGLIDWIHERLRKERMISESDLGLFRVTDDPEEVVAAVRASYEARRAKRGPRAGNGRDTP